MPAVSKEQFYSLIKSLEEKYRHQSNIGLFGPTSILWKITKETFMLFDSGVVLSLQLLNPTIAKALQEHSYINTSPLKRFNKTLDGIAGIIFGDLNTAITISRHVFNIHDKIKGGNYQATEKSLLYYIGSVTLYAHVEFYERYISKLTEREKNQLYEEYKILLLCFGYDTEATNEPTCWHDFRIHVVDDLLDVKNKITSSEVSNLLKHSFMYSIVEWITICNLPYKINKYYNFTLSKPKTLFVKLFMFVTKCIFLYFLPKKLKYLPLYNKAILRLTTN